jgi:hypothetical protein
MSKRKAAKLEVTVTLTLKEVDIKALCSAIHFGDPENTEALFKRLKTEPDYFAKFTKAIQDTGPCFTSEIMDSAYDSCANDWLCEFQIEEEDEDEE